MSPRVANATVSGLQNASDASADSDENDTVTPEHTEMKVNHPSLNDMSHELCEKMSNKTTLRVNPLEKQQDNRSIALVEEKTKSDNIEEILTDLGIGDSSVNKKDQKNGKLLKYLNECDYNFREIAWILDDLVYCIYTSQKNGRNKTNMVREYLKTSMVIDDSKDSSEDDGSNSDNNNINDNNNNSDDNKKTNTKNDDREDNLLYQGCQILIKTLKEHKLVSKIGIKGMGYQKSLAPILEQISKKMIENENELNNYPMFYVPYSWIDTQLPSERKKDKQNWLKSFIFRPSTDVEPQIEEEKEKEKQKEKTSKNKKQNKRAREPEKKESRNNILDDDCEIIINDDSSNDEEKEDTHVQVCQGCKNVLKIEPWQHLPSKTMFVAGPRKAGAKKHSKPEKIYRFCNEQCINLRKYKEAIRQYVFEKEMEAKNLQMNDQLNNFDNQRGRSLSVLQNKDDEKEILERLRQLLSNKDKLILIEDKLDKSGKNETTSIMQQKDVKTRLVALKSQWQHSEADGHNYFEVRQEKSLDDKNSFLERGNTKERFLFRRLRRLSAKATYNRLLINGSNAERKKRIQENEMDVKKDLPSVLTNMDTPLYSKSLFEFIINQLKSKEREALYTVLAFIVSSMNTLDAVDLLQKYKNTLRRFDIKCIDQLCLAIIKRSRYPVRFSMHCFVLLSHF